jgi:hypothetical protein
MPNIERFSTLVYLVGDPTPKVYDDNGNLIDLVTSGSDITYNPASPAVWNPVPTTVQTALDGLAVERTTYVFRPNGIAVGNIFTTWAALYAATLLTPGPKTIYFDNQAGGVCNIPAGAYDFGLGCNFIGILPGDGTTSNRVDIICAEGVTFTTPIASIAQARLTYNGTGVLMTIPATGKIFHFIMRDFARISVNVSGGRLISIPEGAILIFDMYDSAVINAPAAGAFIVDTTGTTVATQFLLNCLNTGQVNGVIPINCFRGGAGPSYVFSANRLSLFAVGTQVVPLAQQNNMPGGVITVTFPLSAPVVPYTPLTAARWVAPIPTNVQNALDRIAAVVGATVPIPV